MVSEVFLLFPLVLEDVCRHNVNHDHIIGKKLEPGALMLQHRDDYNNLKCNILKPEDLVLMQRQHVNSILGQ